MILGFSINTLINFLRKKSLNVFLHEASQDRNTKLRIYNGRLQHYNSMVNITIYVNLVSFDKKLSADACKNFKHVVEIYFFDLN